MGCAWTITGTSSSVSLLEVFPISMLMTSLNAHARSAMSFALQHLVALGMSLAAPPYMKDSLL